MCRQSCLRNVERKVVKERWCRRRLLNASVLTERTLRRSAKPCVRSLVPLYLDVLRLDFTSTLQAFSSALIMVKAVRGSVSFPWVYDGADCY
jgi:hypothetical protein